jgi:hypothetical protein
MLLELGHRTFHQPGVEQALLGEPLVEAHPELLQVLAAVTKLLVEREPVHPGVVLAEQPLRIADERIEVRLALPRGLVVLAFRRRQPGRVGQHLLSRDPGKALLVRIAHLPRHVDDVVPLVAIGRKRHLDPEKDQVAQPGRQRQDVHLPTGIVDVVLALDVESGKIEQRRKRCPVSSPPPVPDVQRPGRICRNELDLHPD